MKLIITLFFLLVHGFSSAERNHDIQVGYSNIYSFDISGITGKWSNAEEWKLHAATRALLLDFVSSDELVTGKFDNFSKSLIVDLIRNRFTKEEYIKFCKDHIGAVDVIEILGVTPTLVFLREGDKAKMVIKYPKKDLFQTTKVKGNANKQVNNLLESFVKSVFEN
jgi:hypothetical protein